MTPRSAGPRLYVYYRVPMDRLAKVTHEVLGMQSALMCRHAGLQAELLRRSDATDADLTLMEIYRAPNGVDAALAIEIERWASGWSRWVVGERHVERFELLPSAPARLDER